MRHLDDDQLLKLAPELPGDEEQREWEQHLVECAECRGRLEAQRRQVEMLGSLRPGVPAPRLPTPAISRPPMRQWLRMAAILLLGFVGGTMASRWWCAAPPNIVPAPRVVQIVSADDATTWAACDVTKVE